MSENENLPTQNFIRRIIAEDLKSGKNGSRVATRFPPEPNGYLHIGHAKAIWLNFQLAAENNGTCNLRFDDTNPVAEDVEFTEAIEKDIKWLGYQWNGEVHWASDYFGQLYEYAVKLIKEGKAYICSHSPEEIRQNRGTLTEPGKNCECRNRDSEENQELFAKMKNGECGENDHVLRAKIDMGSPNMNMRDPIIYRVRNVEHHRTGKDWVIYPMYDYTHCISDSIEKITHSICTLEFEDHRPLYDWFLDELKCDPHPQQIEFARLNVNYTVTSKRKLKELVEEGHVGGWDDPRMPTLVGLRRRGYPPKAIRNFCEQTGVTKKNSVIELTTLENAVRDELNETAPRGFGVLKPLKIVLENYPEGKTEDLEAPIHPQKPEMGTRTMPFTREIFIDEEDFMEDPPKKFFRLGPGREVRLRYGYIIKCNEVVKDASGKVTELKCSVDMDTLGKNPADGRKVKGVIHWVSATDSVETEVRLYDRLFNHPNPNKDDYKTHLNPESLETLKRCRIEKSLISAKPEDAYQFERLGFFVADRYDTKDGKPVFNRIVTLRDTWASSQNK